MILGLVLYVVVTVVVHLDGLDYLHRHGGAMRWMTWVAWYGTRGDGRVVFFPWSSMPLTIATVAGMRWSIRALRHGAAIARLGTFFLSFGLVLPQAILLFLYLSGPRDLSCGLSLAITLPLVMLPVLAFGAPGVARRFDAHEQDLSWAKLRYGRLRLIATGILTCWMSFLGVLYVGFSDYIGSAPGVVAALASIVLAVAAVRGLLALRTWSVLVALLVPVLAWVYLLAWRTRAIESGYLEPRWNVPWTTCLLGVPAFLVVLLVWPFLRAMGKHVVVLFGRHDDV